MKRAACPARSGFTLVEMLVAMVIAMIIILLTSFAWRNATQVVARTEALLRAHEKAATLMKTLQDQVPQVSSAAPFLLDDELWIRNQPNLAAIQSEREWLPNQGGTRKLRDTSLPPDPVTGLYPEAVWGLGDVYNATHPFWDPRSEGKFVQVQNFNSTSIASVAMVFRHTFGTERWSNNRYENPSDATGYDSVWKTNLSNVRYGQTKTPTLNKFPFANLKFAYRCINRDDDPNKTYTTGSAEPTWPTRYGETVEDGEVTWQAVAPNLYFVPVAEVRFCYDEQLITRGSLVTTTKETLLATDNKRIFPVFAADQRVYAPFAYGIGHFKFEWSDNSDTDGKTWANREASFYRNATMNDKNCYRDLHSIASTTQDPAGYKDHKYRYAYAARGFVANDVRGGEPPYHPRWIKVKFSAVEIPFGTVGEGVEQDFAIRIWLR